MLQRRREGCGRHSLKDIGARWCRPHASSCRSFYVSGSLSCLMCWAWPVRKTGLASDGVVLQDLCQRKAWKDWKRQSPSLAVGWEKTLPWWSRFDGWVNQHVAAKCAGWNTFSLRSVQKQIHASSLTLTSCTNCNPGKFGLRHAPGWANHTHSCISQKHSPPMLGQPWKNGYMESGTDLGPRPLCECQKCGIWNQDLPIRSYYETHTVNKLLMSYWFSSQTLRAAVVIHT